MWETWFCLELPDQLRGLRSQLDSSVQKIAARQGLTLMQMRALLELHSHPASTVGSLSRLTGDNQGNCSSLCKKLAQAGFIDRTRGQNDERQVTLCLTPKGEQAISAITNELGSRFQPLLSALDPSDVEMIQQSFAIMRGLITRFAQENDPEEPHQ
jgi:DNA-binding MarR family transcriptional regulator